MRQARRADRAAISDVYRKRLEEALAQSALESRHGYVDYQDLLARPDFDAVWIATPDHWHSPMALDALAEDKDIYLEEPMAYTVEEERRIIDAVERSGRVLQIGSLDVLDKHYHQEPPRRLRREVWSAGRPKLAVPSGSLKRFPNALLLVGRTVPTEGKRL